MTTRFIGVFYAALAGAAILLAVQPPALAAAGQPQIFPHSLEAPIIKAVYDWELFGEDPVPPVPYYDPDNYCWQQVWTAHGWRWVDACYGYAF